MANQKVRNQLIDAFTQLLEESNSKSIAREYSKVLNAIQKEALEMLNTKGNLKASDIRKIINANPFNTEVFNMATIKDYIGSGVTLVMENPNTTDKALLPILGLLQTTGLNPIKIVNRIEAWSTQITRKGVPIGKYKGVIITLKEYVGVTNAKQITNISSEWKKEITTINKRITTQLSRDMVNDLRKLQKSTTIFDQEGNRLETRRPLTQEEINTRLKSKYRNASARVERIIRTEVSAQNELVRRLDAQTKGYNKKRWINENDSKVRQSHKGQIERQRPSINEEFTLFNKQTGKSSKAQYPKDPQLPVEERVNCRCTVAYSR